MTFLSIPGHESQTLPSDLCKGEASFAHEQDASHGKGKTEGQKEAQGEEKEHRGRASGKRE